MSAYVAWFFGTFFLVNAIPHWVSGLMGRPFQSPFAKPIGVGLSSSTVNALWGCLNLAIGYALVLQVGEIDLRNVTHAGIVLVAIALRSVLAARHYGRFHGGNAPV